jgi:hypothetical protein
MDAKLKKTIIIVGSSTAIGFLGDVIMYSLAMSKGQKFKVHFPKGKDLVQVLVVGFVTGLVVDAVVNAIVESQKKPQEKALDKLVKADLDRLEKGELKTPGPVAIKWA